MYGKCLKVGDRVKILRTDMPKRFLKRKNKNGWVIAVDGAYHMVRPMWAAKDDVYELYPNEIELLG